MSYRNPKQIVDTQSGQYVREMQRSLADTSSKYFTSAKQEFERRAKLNAKIVADSQERVNKISNQVNQVANANKAINFDQMYDNLDTYNKYMQINPAKRTREMNLFISNMDNSGTTLRDKLANTVAAGEPFMEAMEKGIGVPGGVYSGVKDLKKYEVMYGYNQAPGSKKMNYDPVTNEFRVNVIGENGESLGSSLNQDMEHLDTPQIVPDETKNMENIAAEVHSRMDLKNVNSPAYANQEYQLPTKVGNVTYLSKLPSRSVYLELATPLAKAEIEGMTAGEGIALFNDVIGKGKVMEWQETWTDPNDPRKQIIAEAYAEHIADGVGKSTLLKAGPRIKEVNRPPEEGVGTGGDFYDKIKKDPTSYFNEYTEIPAILDEKKNTITIPKKYLEEGKDEEDLVIDMNNKQSKISFYTRILEASGIAKGTSEKAKLIRKQFSEAIRADKLGKPNPNDKSPKKELEEFQKRWNEENPDLGPMKENQSFRFARMMDAYNEYKKNKNQ